MATTDPSSGPLLHDPSTPALILSTTTPHDPPPPYPSARRPRQNRRRRTPLDGTEHSHSQIPSDEYDFTPTHTVHRSAQLRPPFQCHDGPDDVDPTETTPLLGPTRDQVISSSPRSQTALPPGIIHRRRTLSLTSTLRSNVSLAPSFAHTVFSAFHPERDADIDPECRADFGEDEDHEHEELGPESDSPAARDYDQQQRTLAADLSGYAHRSTHRTQYQQLSLLQRWRMYFRPFGRRSYYSAAFHLVVLNFPYALVAWLFIFVFTLVGTCTLMALPLGAAFCFIDLFGARLLARGELALQTTYHGPLSYPLPHPPLPIFTRMRTPTASQIEAGVPASALVYETSFYGNSYAMFTDPTSYQALFYFLVIKPGITVFMFLLFLVLLPLAAVAVIPLPAILRLARRMGIWQANVAVEGLYFAAR